MINNEAELLKLIREHDDPAKALVTATLVILEFLKQHESSEEQAVADSRESY